MSVSGAQAPSSHAHVSPEFIAAHTPAESSQSTAVMVDGILRPELSSLSGLPAGVYVGDITNAPSQLLELLVSSRMLSCSAALFVHRLAVCYHACCLVCARVYVCCHTLLSFNLIESVRDIHAYTSTHLIGSYACYSSKTKNYV